ncbi:MAG: HAD family hydrolase [Treponema sp.]|jgi:putative hydrolase of the HAD superfamily|nr:HAD family hydrolase [Treponema sp.]
MDELDRTDEVERRRLAAIIRESAAPLEPQAPPLPPDWEGLLSAPRDSAAGSRALLFDVYGTLFCSAAGDIGPAGEAGAEAGISGGPAGETADSPLEALARRCDPRLTGNDLPAFFRRKVSEIHRSRAAETAWPEVSAPKIWAELLREQGLAADGRASREFALRYELAVNPVWPMPGAAETIAALRDSGRVLGIISNAQFFTPLLFEAFFGAPPESLGFDPELIIWSFAMGEAKPSPRLFDAALRTLASRGISAAETSFVGNDMLSDIYGAARAGFQCVLFAGDSRSLRLRHENPLLRGLRPSRIIRSLGELAAGI